MTTRRVLRWTGLAVLGVLVLSGSALARDQESPDEHGDPTSMDSGEEGARPWADGVSPDNQAAARQLFDEANRLLRDSLFLKAADKYREALAFWDHPAIHYNLALALLNMDQPLEVYRHLEQAMRYGPAPLDVNTFERATSYQTLVEKQLAYIEVVCDQPDAKVSMDGRLLFVAPGKYEGLVRVGEHSITATKPGYITANEARMLDPSERARIELRLYTPDDVTGYRRRWTAWKPWAIVGVGLAVGLVGGAMHVKSVNDFADFDQAINECGGCVPSDELLAQRDRAGTEQTVAIASYVAGGTIALTGMVLVYANRSKPYRLDVEQAFRVSVVPIVGPDGTGVTAAFRF